MTKNTLRYHHKCPGKPIDTYNLPVKRRIKQETSEPKLEAKQPTYHEKLNERIEQKSEKIAKLEFQIAYIKNI